MVDQDRLGTPRHGKTDHKRMTLFHTHIIAGQPQHQVLRSAGALQEPRPCGSAVWCEEHISFAMLLILTMIILPRQARDKHRESTQKEMRFFAGDAPSMGPSVFLVRSVDSFIGTTYS